MRNCWCSIRFDLSTFQLKEKLKHFIDSIRFYQNQVFNSPFVLVGLSGTFLNRGTVYCCSVSLHFLVDSIRHQNYLAEVSFADDDLITES